MVNISEEFRQEARRKGLCDDWFYNWGEPDKQGLIDKALHGVNFLCNNNYPPLQWIEKHFDRDMLRRNNFFVNDEVHGRNNRPIAVMNGCCNGMLMYDGYTIAKVYIRHDSKIFIDASENCKLFISVYDDADVTIRQSETARVYVYTHGDNCRVETIGEVFIRSCSSSDQNTGL